MGTLSPYFTKEELGSEGTDSPKVTGVGTVADRLASASFPSPVKTDPGSPASGTYETTQGDCHVGEAQNTPRPQLAPPPGCP